MKHRLKIFLLSLVLFVFPILACNLPIGPDARRPAATATPDAAVQATQEAQLFPFPTLAPADPGVPGAPTPVDPGLAPLQPGQSPFGDLPYTYFTQPGDTLSAVAARFAVPPE